MAALIDQLRQLRADLQALVDSDEEQEVMPPALTLVDAVLSEARATLPADSTLGSQIVDLISVETVAAGEAVRAAELLIITGQLLAVLERDERHRLEEATRHAEQDLQTWQALQASVPRTGSITFVADHPWEYSFDFDELAPLERYLNRSGLPDRMFFDVELETRRKEFAAVTAALFEFINPRVGEYGRTTNRYRLHPDESLDWETPETATIFADLRRAAELSQQIVRSYDALWAAARARLNI